MTASKNLIQVFFPKQISGSWTVSINVPALEIRITKPVEMNTAICWDAAPAINLGGQLMDERPLNLTDQAVPT